MPAYIPYALRAKGTVTFEVKSEPLPNELTVFDNNTYHTIDQFKNGLNVKGLEVKLSDTNIFQVVLPRKESVTIVFNTQTEPFYMQWSLSEMIISNTIISKKKINVSAEVFEYKHIKKVSLSVARMD